MQLREQQTVVCATWLDTHTSTTGGGVLFISASQALVSLILLGIYEGEEDYYFYEDYCYILCAEPW